MAFGIKLEHIQDLRLYLQRAKMIQSCLYECIYGISFAKPLFHLFVVYDLNLMSSLFPLILIINILSLIP